MNYIDKLTQNITAFITKKAEEYDYDLEATLAFLAELNFRTMYQSIRRDAEPVYAYKTSGMVTDYHSAELFPGRATLIFRDYDFSHDVVDCVEANHFLELWVKEDMTLAVVACYCIRYEDDEMVTEFREYKGEDWPDSSLCLDVGCLFDWLGDLCEEDEENPVFFEP